MSQLLVLVFLAFFLLRWAVETGLAGLNLAHLLATPATVPEPLKGRLDEATAGKSRDYALARLRFGLLLGAGHALGVLATLFSGVLPWLEGALARSGLAGAHLFVAFLVSLTLAFSLAHLPFSLYALFGIETRFGFNRMTWRMWLLDRLKLGALAAALGLPFLYAVYGFMQWSGGWWWAWLFGFITVWQLALGWLYPSLIAPLFNRFEPLPEGELRTRLEALARQAGFRTGGIFVMDASRRSGHSNAYFTGLFRPRIVLFDTLLEEMPVDESLAVLAHEIGHFRMRHVRRGLLLGLAWLFLMLFVLSLLAGWPPLFSAFGFAAPSHHGLLALVGLGGGAFTFFVAPLLAWLSRRREYAADSYSVRLLNLPGALKSALVRLNGQNLSNLNPHPWYSGYHYSHPTLLQRLAAVDRLGAAGGVPPA